ncbi:MAG: HAD family hydrolase [Acidimicrobiia bacterium]|nr:HAD family hydrolase [Acidimicrobiia bacterium]NNC92923.1 HAD family hydrolase [Acidimicrobiia bacterium]
MTTVPSTVRHVIFDYGGTLADLIFPLTVFRRFSPTTTMGSGEIKPPHFLQRQARKLAYPVAARMFRPFSGLHEVLGELQRRGYRLHVLSNNSSILPLQLELIDTTDYFDTTSWSEEMGVEKPDARIFELALERIGAAPDEVVYVGDSYEADVAGARGAGIVPIHADHRGRRPEGSELRVESLFGLLDLLPPVQ